MTKEERKELERIKVARGRYEEEEAPSKPSYKDIEKTSVWRLNIFGRLIEIRVSNPRK